MWIFIVVFTVIGIISLISPRASWYLSNWWRYEGETEPSSFSLLLYRIGGKQEHQKKTTFIRSLANECRQLLY
ncbi:MULTISPECIES: DUF6199 family natural product biosynthesis protein [Paenibacillus]|uniref:DUF6199 domain-containing protein n=1 Tax=Paenibacillus borealis TaxID=160799 RepID=A0ABX3GZQ5_PAEBO|nr:DUF6199 family natural product biosynthesis protein [Paenibacillus borealis]OMD40825.1 hypothetical protein BSK56_28115 [Paenibacillus borealis]